MQYVGFFLVGIAVIAIIIGVVQQMKAKKILAAPFRRTAEVAQNPQAGDAKGLVSCEGAVQIQQPMMAPCSGKPCVYYEIEIERQWEKSVNTEQGVKTEKGKDTINTTKQGSQFYLNDGSGPVGVDARESVDCDLEKAFEQQQNIAWGDVVFGQFHTHIPHDGSDEKVTRGVKATEKILPAQGNFFVMGKLMAGAVTKTDGLLGKLLISSKGRDKLIGATKRNALIGFIAGGVLVLPGGYFSVFGEPPVDNCANMTDAIATMCTGRITNDSGNTYDWAVTKPGSYTVEILQPNVKVPIIPVLTITDSTGAKLTPSDEEVERVTMSFKAGKYKINVRDSMKGDAAKFKGGFSFSLNIKSEGGAAAPTEQPVVANPTNTTTPAKLGTKPGIKPATGGAIKPATTTTAPAATTAAAAAPAATTAAAKPTTTAAPALKPTLPGPGAPKPSM